MSDDLFDFFFEGVCSVNSSLSEESRFYITTLLVGRVQQQVTTTPNTSGEATLADLYFQAGSAPTLQKGVQYKELGDYALYRCGWFRVERPRRQISQEYYVSMGSTAYSHAHVWLHAGFGNVFKELSTHFGECVHILHTLNQK